MVSNGSDVDYQREINRGQIRSRRRTHVGSLYLQPGRRCILDRDPTRRDAMRNTGKARFEERAFRERRIITVTRALARI